MPICNIDGELNRFSAGLFAIEMSMGCLELTSGKYSITVGVIDAITDVMLARVQGLSPFRVTADSAHWGKIVRRIVPEKIDVLVRSS